MISLGTNGQFSAPQAPVFSCKLVGIGNAGLSVLDRLAPEASGPLEFVAMHTAAQALMASPAERKLQLGRDSVRGLGSGGDPAVGRAAALEQAEDIRSECEGAQMVIVCAGLGGGTGSGAAPVVAEAARRAGALVFGLVTFPFAGEGGRRREQAEAALAKLGRHCVAVLCFENDRMSEIVVPGAPAIEAFGAASSTMAGAVRSLLRMVGLPSLLHAGLDELAQMFRGASARCQFGHGASSGPDRAAAAVEAALACPLLDGGAMLAEPGGVLVHIAADPSLRLSEIESVLGFVSQHVPSSSQLFLGVGIDGAAKDALVVTLMASSPGSSQYGAGELEEIEAAQPEDEAGGDAKPPKRGKATRKTASGQTQEELPLDEAVRGRFKDLDPTVIEGQDLDIPSYIRLRLRLK